MWLFRTKPVVHVDVTENNPPAPGTTSDLVASYTLVGDPQAPRHLYVDEGAPFNYAREVTAHVKNGVRPHLDDEKARKRLVVKIWRDDATRSSHPFEKAMTRGLLGVLVIEVLLIAAVAAAVLILFPDPGSTANGAAWAGIATSAAFLAGHIAVRVSRLAQPFEYTKWRSLMVGLLVLVPVLLNTLVVTGFLEWFFKLFSVNWEQLAETFSVILAIGGLVFTIFGAVIQGAWDVLKWALLEEAQRNSAAARTVIDGVERRQEVNFQANA